MRLKSILLIEDDGVSALAFKKSLSRAGNPAELLILDTAEKALVHLRSTSSYPNLIVLDLDLPTMNGMQFLDQIKEDEQLKKIPVIVLTTSVNPEHKLACFHKQAAGYFIKPVDYAMLLRLILDYWTNSEFAPIKVGGDFV